MFKTNHLNSQSKSTSEGSGGSIYSNNTTALKHNSIWKYYKIYEDNELKNSDLVIPQDSPNNIVRLVQSRNAAIYTTGSNNKELSIFDFNTNHVVLSNLNINDTDIELHNLIDIQIIEDIGENTAFIVTIFENVINNNNINSPYIIKLYNYEDLLINNSTNKTVKYHSMVTINDTLGKNKYPITKFIINSDLNIALLGLSNGNVFLVRGDLKRDRGYKQRLVFKSLNNQPITNLKFINNCMHCIVSTVDKVLILNTDGKINDKQHMEKNFFQMINDKEGCSLNLIDAFNDDKVYLLNDGFINIYSCKNGYTKLDTILLNAGYKTQEPLVLKCLNKNEILILSKIISSNPNEINESYRLSIIDLENHVTTLNTIYNIAVKDIIEIANTNDIEIILQTGRKYTFVRKPVKDIVTILLNQSSISDFEFELAITFLKQNNLQTDDVLKKYGDFLYSENRTSEAMQKYIKCLDYFVNESKENLDTNFKHDDNGLPSITEIVIKYAMQKKQTLLNDNENLNNLIKFLEGLLEKEFETKPDYTTLLMILLIKLNKWTEFIELINTLDRYGKYNKPSPTANQAYHNFSVQEDEDYWYSDIIIFDVNLITQLLIDIMVNESNEYFSEIKDLLFKITVKFNRDPEKIVCVLIKNLKFSKFAINWIQRLDPAGLMNVIFGTLGVGKLLLDVDDEENSSPSSVIDLYVELFSGKYKQISSKQKKIIQTYQPPKPSIIFNFFINHRFKFVSFLEQLIKSGCIENKKEYELCVNALYSTYVNLHSVEKAQKLYQDEKDIISDLMIDYSEPNKDEVSSSLNLAMITNNVSEVIEIVQNKESINKETLIKILRYVSSKQSVLSEYTENRLSLLIEYLLGKKYLSMNELIMILSETNVVSFGVIKTLLINWVTEKEEEIKKQKQKLETFETKEQDSFKKDLPHNKDKACFICELPIEKPYYKFNCGHVVDKNCITQSDEIVCPNCSSGLEIFKDSVNSINHYSKNNDAELEQVLKDFSETPESADSGFELLLKLIGNGVLEIE